MFTGCVDWVCGLAAKEEVVFWGGNLSGVMAGRN